MASAGSPLPSAAFRSNYGFVMNVEALREPMGFPLVEGHELRRATPEEIVEIKTTLARLAGPEHNMVKDLWEYQRPMVGPSRLLPEAEWRYFVVAFQGLDRTLRELQDVFDLATVELEIAFTIMHSPAGGFGVGESTGWSWQPERLFQALRRALVDDRFFVEIGSCEVAEMATIHAHLWKSQGQVRDLRPFVAELGQLKGLPYNSPLRFLGHFAILESLLTHMPDPNDRYDSITRQIKKKLALLNNRWLPPIDYGPFGNAAAEKVWAAMYDYRSKVAHGGVADFTGKLRILKNHEDALKLVKDTTKAVIRHALKEPQLLIDLREC